MKTDEFVKNMEKWLTKTNNTYDFTVGDDMGINTRLTVDKDGFIWIRDFESFKRVKTTVNVSDITELRLCDFDDNCFYIICADDSGFEVHQSEIYYCIDGRPSGWGSAAAHFRKYPNGTVEND